MAVKVMERLSNRKWRTARGIHLRNGQAVGETSSIAWSHPSM